MPEPLLTVDALDAHYGDVQALHGVSLDVEDGEVVAVIGANGAGKTTLMRAVAGLLRSRPDAVRWRGRPIGALPPHEVARLGEAVDEGVGGDRERQAHRAAPAARAASGGSSGTWAAASAGSAT